MRLYFDEGTAEKLAEAERPALTLLENKFKKKDSDPDYVLLWPKEKGSGSPKANVSRFKKKAKPVQEELEEEETEEDDDEESEDDTDEDSDYEEED